ncbi:MAG: flavodoxin [Succinivibrio sp.]
MKKIIKNILCAAVLSSGAASADTLVVYYSASGCTQRVAEIIARTVNAETVSLQPVQTYTDDDLNWRDPNSRVSREHDNESLRDVNLVNAKIENFDRYDTVFVGYPIWWSIAAWPVNTFIKSNSLKGKKIIPFATSASSPFAQSGELLEKMADGGNWTEGKRFSSYADEREIVQWAQAVSSR